MAHPTFQQATRCRTRSGARTRCGQAQRGGIWGARTDPADVDAGRPHSQFRIRGFDDVPDADGLSDLAHFVTSDNVDFGPRLEIVYLVP